MPSWEDSEALLSWPTSRLQQLDLQKLLPDSSSPRLLVRLSQVVAKFFQIIFKRMCLTSHPPKWHLTSTSRLTVRLHRLFIRHSLDSNLSRCNRFFTFKLGWLRLDCSAKKELIEQGSLYSKAWVSNLWWKTTSGDLDNFFCILITLIFKLLPSAAILTPTIKSYRM